MNRSKNKSNIDIVKSYLSGERPFIQFGYEVADVRRKIGDTWTDSNGIKWEQRKGYKANINQQANLIRAATTRICSDCNLDIKWGSPRDEQAFNETGKCDECLVKFQTKLMFYGIMNIYDKWKMLSQNISILKDIKEKIKDSISYLLGNDGNVKILCNSEGFLETFRGFDKDKFLTEAKDDLQKINLEISKLSRKRNYAKNKFYKKYNESEQITTKHAHKKIKT